jgi:hypothetical protein
MRVPALTITFALLVAPSSVLLAQSFSPTDAGSFVDFSLRSISNVPQQNRRGARDLVAVEIAAFPQNVQTSCVDALIGKLAISDTKTKDDVAAILSNLPNQWMSSHTSSDAQAIYRLMQTTSDVSSKALLDGALANAKGLYKDGIRDFNTSDEQFKNAEAKLQTMLQEYPDSRYAENANFYLGQYYTKAFILSSPRDPSLLAKSNTTYEDYIAKTEPPGTRFGGKRTFLAAGYYFRGLNGWLASNTNDARTWLNAGQSKFADTDSVYVYQPFYSRGDTAAVVDRLLPAKALFLTTLQFIGGNPGAALAHADDLAAAIRNL